MNDSQLVLGALSPVLLLLALGITGAMAKAAITAIIDRSEPRGTDAAAIIFHGLDADQDRLSD